MKNLFKFIFLILLLSLSPFFQRTKNLGNQILRSQTKDIKIIEKYFKLCNDNILLNKKKFKRIKNPKISLISPIYNKEKYLLRFLRSVQNQYFDDIEIILVDDFSKDKTIQIIEYYKKEDERIILIKHNNNKGTLISRNEGALLSKGEFLIFVDPDDILSNDILKYCYKIAKKYSYDIIRFSVYNGNGKVNLGSIINEIKTKTIYQPELSLFIFYGLGDLKQIDYFIWNKFIKKNVFILALNSLNNYYLNQYMIDCEDGLINFILHRTAKSYYFSKKIGYYYIYNNKSITFKNKDNYIKRIKSNFLYFKFFYQYTFNNKREKKIAEYIFITIFNDIKLYFFKLLKEIIKDIELYKEVIELYLNCEYITLKTRKILEKIKSYIENYIKNL